MTAAVHQRARRELSAAAIARSPWAPAAYWASDLMQGKQKLMFLPDAHTDFIYATIGEELGLWGATAVLAGFLVILWRGARLFVLARDDFGKYLALGVTVSIVVQALINMSVVLDMAPDQGIPSADDQLRRQFAAEHADVSGNAVER